MQTASSAKRTWSARASASEWTATVLIPSSRHARMMRRAISPRLAMRILRNIGSSASGPIASQRVGLTRKDKSHVFLMRKSFWPNSTALPFCAKTSVIVPECSASISFISFIASTMQSVCPIADDRADLDERRGVRARRAVERADERARHVH